MKVLVAGPAAANITMSNSGEDRKPGVHLSDILKRMAYERDKKYHPDNPVDAMTLECGFIWERVLERALADRHQNRAGYRPDQIQEDGIWLSPDWVAPEQDIQVEEWKATRKSTKSYEQKVHEWLPQVKSYLRALARRGVARRLAVRLRVWFMVGDWTFESKGDHTLLRDYWEIDLEFDKRELEENWREIVSHGYKYGLLKQPPSEDRWDSRTGKKSAASRTSRTILQQPHLKLVKAKKLSSKAQPQSRGTARIVTFPNGKRSQRLHAES